MPEDDEYEDEAAEAEDLPDGDVDPQPDAVIDIPTVELLP